MTLGQKLQLLRTNSALSQEELAARLNVSRQAISKWELDKTVPEVKYIVMLSDLFQVTTDELLKGHSPAPEKANKVHPASPPPTAGTLFPIAAACAVIFTLAADVIYTAAHIFYIRELYTFSLIVLLLALILLPVLLTGWRLHLRTAATSINCRRTVSAGARLWCFGLMLLCGFHQVIEDLFISPGFSAFYDDIGSILFVFAAVILGLWAAGRLCALLFPKNTEL